MKRTSKVVLGLCFIIAGILFILNAAGVVNINLFFDGWWTLFIIIPCFFGLLGDGDKGGSIAGIAIGVLLLLAAQERIMWEDFGKYAIGVLIIMIGYCIIFGKKHLSSVQKEEIKRIEQDGKFIQDIDYAFGKFDREYSNQKFEGAHVKTAFGGGRIDLRGAIIEDDCIIKLDCSFGGVEIIVPDNISVNIVANSAFGGIKDARRNPARGTKPCIYITGNVSFGGVEIK